MKNRLQELNSVPAAGFPVTLECVFYTKYFTLLVESNSEKQIKKL